MDLAEYLEKTKGFGVFAAADSEGNLNVAALSRPTVTYDRTAALIMDGRT